MRATVMSMWLPLLSSPPGSSCLSLRLSTSILRVPAVPLPPVNLPSLVASARCPVTPAAIQAFQRVRSGNDRAWKASLEARLVAAIRKWQGIIVQAPLEFDLGRRVGMFLRGKLLRLCMAEPTLS